MRSLHSFFSTYLLHLILFIISSFSLVFKIGSVLMVFLLIGSHLISPLALRQSQSMIPSLHSLLSPVVYPKVPYLVHSFSLSIQLLLARWSKKIPKIYLYADETQLYISFKFHFYEFCSISWNTTTFTGIHSWMNLNKLLLNPSKLNFFLLVKKNNVSNFLI